MSNPGTIFMLRPRSTIAYGQDFLDAHMSAQPGFSSLAKENGVYPIGMIEGAQVVVGQNPDDGEESRTLNHLATRGEKTAVFVHCQWEYYSNLQQENVAHALENATIGMTPARFLTERMQAQFRDVRWKTVDGCVDEDFFYPSVQSERDVFRSSIGLAEGERVALFAGRLEAAKGTQILRDICASPRREFAILVQYPAWDEIRKKARLFNSYLAICEGLSAFPNVYCIPDDDPRSKPRPVRHADIFVSPSLSEVQPLVLLEALASGIPFVGTDSTPDYAELQHRFQDSKVLSSTIETVALPRNLHQGAIPRSTELSDESQPIADTLVEVINKKAVPDDRLRAAVSREFLARGFTIPDRILKFREALEDPGLQDISPEQASLEDLLL